VKDCTITVLIKTEDIWIEESINRISTVVRISGLVYKECQENRCKKMTVS
jgi:hypothetical protein